MIAIFDLPVSTKKERKLATGFRNFLLDQGFEMVQFSVYMKHCAGKEQADGLYSRIKVNAPEIGNVKLLTITDRQFANIIHLGRHSVREIRTEQLALF